MHKTWLFPSAIILPSLSIITAPNGPPSLFVNPDIDLLITDMMMPNMNGDALYQELLLINSRLKAIILSGKTSVKLPPNALFLEKPYNIAELKDLISQLLAKQYDS